MAAGANRIANGDMILIIWRKGKNNSQPPLRTAQYTNLTLFSGTEWRRQMLCAAPEQLGTSEHRIKLSVLSFPSYVFSMIIAHHSLWVAVRYNRNLWSNITQLWATRPSWICLKRVEEQRRFKVIKHVRWIVSQMHWVYFTYTSHIHEKEPTYRKGFLSKERKTHFAKWLNEPSVCHIKRELPFEQVGNGKRHPIGARGGGVGGVCASLSSGKLRQPTVFN